VNAGNVEPATHRTNVSTPGTDLCHGGLVLRAVLFVHAVLAVGIVFAAGSFEEWLAKLGMAASVAMPAALLWLVVACLLKRNLARLPEIAQWSAVVALGTGGAVGCWALQTYVGLGLWVDSRWLAPGRWLGPALAGAAFSMMLFYWFGLRARVQGPADSSARLAELQSRIHPHFLFNTLNTAITLARVDPARTERLLEDLAELFRVALANTDNAVTLGSEVELARRYLAIEKLRFGDRLRVSWEIDPAAASARVPFLLLQPLVENAVRHGVEPSPGGGEVRILTNLRRGHAQIVITNSVPLDPSRPGAGMALRNLRERVQLMYDVAAQFDVGLEHGLFRVQITVPFVS